MKTLTLTAAFVMMAASADAQFMDRKSLNADGAKRVIAAAVSYAKKENTTGVIAVVDDGGNLMAVERIDGTFPAGAKSPSAKRAPQRCSSAPPKSLRT